MRVVRLMQNAGCLVRWTRRNGDRDGAEAFDIESPSSRLLRDLITPETTLLHSIPTIRTKTGLREYTPELVEALRSCPPAHVVYLSTTGVYGPTQTVDEQTSPAPVTERELVRVNAENAIRSGPWSTLILRPAAIYGPGRGIHAAMRAGTFRLPEQPGNFVSRIHADDLAAHAYAALFSTVEGAYPVADQEPCTSLEAARFCAELLGLPLPERVPTATLGETRRADRKVDGSAIRNLLKLTLRYPTYKVGFPACLAEEDRIRATS